MSETTKSKVAVAVQQEDRFAAPRPAYNAPTNVDHITPRVKDNTPAPSIVERAKKSDDPKLAAMLEKWDVAQKKAREAFERSQAQKEGRPLPKVTRVRKAKAPVPCIAPVQFNPEDVVDPATFIKRTVNGDYHSPEMKRLFFANGGGDLLKTGLSYANAFGNLRQAKMKELQATKK
jgi:hypothetical protein